MYAVPPLVSEMLSTSQHATHLQYVCRNEEAQRTGTPAGGRSSFCQRHVRIQDLVGLRIVFQSLTCVCVRLIYSSASLQYLPFGLHFSRISQGNTRVLLPHLHLALRLNREGFIQRTTVETNLF